MLRVGDIVYFNPTNWMPGSDPDYTKLPGTIIHINRGRTEYTIQWHDMEGAQTYSKSELIPGPTFDEAITRMQEIYDWIYD